MTGSGLEGSGFVPSDPLQALFAEVARSGSDGSRVLLELNHGMIKFNLP